MDVSARRDFTPPTHIGIIGMLDVGVMVTLNASLSWAQFATEKANQAARESRASWMGKAVCGSTDLR